MSNEAKIILLKQRRAILESRGSHNSKLVSKIDRKIRSLENKE